jgi:hypothetical protein
VRTQYLCPIKSKLANVPKDQHSAVKSFLPALWLGVA